MFRSRRTAAPAGTHKTHATRSTHTNGTHAPVGTTRSKPSLMQRLRGNKAHTTRTTKHSHNPLTGTHTTTHTETTHGAPHSTHAAPHTTRSTGRRSHRTAGTTTAAPAHHHRRRPSLGDKMSGAMMKLRGSLTRRPGLKAAGTRRMHGTDGRGARY
ncbi:Protein transport protein sec72 [Elsinoe australis]|uniref:Protein transport protein sec72 n=1 Tax=Elsinoe australis TaxID=40998 RepID=A0A2P7ZY40_9PEZI|nr:Protein transport protein sec72 [Elsinoe australis]